MIPIFENEDMLLVDEFLDNPDEIALRGRTSTFGDFHASIDGQVYKRVSVQEIPEVVEKLNEVMGRPIQLLGMAYRLNYEGETPNNEIHADLGWGTHALVLYLSEPQKGSPQSGTAFWSHRTAKADRIRVGEVEKYEAVRHDWNNADAWEQTAFVSSKYNSAVIYKSELFHSRWPFSAYGSTPEDGRLAVVAFFS